VVFPLAHAGEVDRQFQARDLEMQLSWVLEKGLKKKQNAVDQNKNALREP